MGSLKKQVISGVKWTTLGTITIAVVALLKIAVLARLLDKSDFGLMALVTFVMGFMNLFSDMGLTSAILHKQEISKKEYASLYWFNLGFSFLLYGILIVLTPLVSIFYNEPQLNILTPLLGLNLLISAFGRMYKTIESKHLLFKRITIFEIIAALFSLVFAIYLAVEGFGVLALVYSALLQYLVQNILFLALGIWKYGLLIHFRLQETKPFLRIGIFQVGGQVINYLNRDMDILLIGKFFSQDILGGYSLAKQLVSRPAQILNPIMLKVASPTLAKFQSQQEELKRNYLKLVNMVSNANVFVYVITIIFAPIIVELFYGSELVELANLVRILSVYMIIRAIGNPVGSLLIATGRTDLDLYWNLITFMIMPLVILIGTYFSVESVALFITLAMLALVIPSWYFLIFKLTGASLGEYLFSLLPKISPKKIKELLK